MKESREKLLKQIYDYDQNFGGPYQFDSDGTEVGIDMLTLRNDVDYLKDKKYVIKTTSPLSTYRLSLTENALLRDERIPLFSLRRSCVS